MTLWNVPSGEILQEMMVAPRTHPSGERMSREPLVGALALSHDGRLVALARTGGNEVEIWETASGMRRGVLNGHEGPVVSLSFSADDIYLASGSEDTTVLVWDVHRPLQSTEPKSQLTGEDIAAHWETLTRPNGQDADSAIWCLIRAPKDAVPFLKERLRPVARDRLR